MFSVTFSVGEVCGKKERSEWHDTQLQGTKDRAESVAKPLPNSKAEE